MAYTHFTRDDRVRLAVLLRAKTKREEIGRILNKNPIMLMVVNEVNGLMVS